MFNELKILFLKRICIKYSYSYIHNSYDHKELLNWKIFDRLGLRF